jgi:hypothetical protein
VRLAGRLAQGDQDDATPLDQPAVIELGSDLPIERLRDRELLLRVAAEEWYGAG